MITEYIQSALKKAHYEFLPNDKIYYGEIPDIKGVFATSKNLEDCREELREVLEEWILVSVKNNFDLPTIDNISIEVRKIA